MAVSTTKSVKEPKKEVVKGDYPESIFGKETVEVFIVPFDPNDKVIEGCLNGHNWRVPVGAKVTIPVSVNEIIMQTRRTIMESAASQKDFERGEINLTV